MPVRHRTPWLSQEEQAEVIDNLLTLGLLKFDNSRSLPLKSGGTTDIYLNLREARSNPKALAYLAELFSHPIRKLHLHRFVEIPDSVSCLAGPLAIATGLPFMTVRETAKAGRVGDANTIGVANRGELVAIIDDVITDGVSKIAPYRECRKRGLNVRGLVVLVDRQQGWQNTFVREAVNLDVWPGMTLHDVRKHLIRSGVMERCSDKAEEENPIIVALDGKNWNEILPILDVLRTTGCILKVNDLMFALGIETVMPDLSTYGRVMLDLKGHDIPNTIANVCKRIYSHRPWAVTVHASGGEEMVKAAVEGLAGSKTKVLAVTVLTSVDKKTCKEVYARRPLDEVLKLAEVARRAGAHGLVCSPEEVKKLRKLYPRMTLVTPGIRSAGVSAGDQKRTGTPAQALKDGASNLVMGRQIFDSPDPAAEVVRLLKEEARR